MAQVLLVRPRTAKQEITRAAKKPRLWRCQFCKNGYHGSCPGAVWHNRPKLAADGKTQIGTEPVLWRCMCEEPGHPHFPYCTQCKNDTDGDVNPRTWLCLDHHACAARLEARRRNSELWQMLQRCKSVAAIQRRARRLGIDNLVVGIDPAEDARIERMIDEMAALAAAKKQAAPRRPRVPKATSGVCDCCGEPTKGGRFLPGHDAKLASRLKDQVKAGSVEAYEEMKRRSWLIKLPADLRNGPTTAK